MLFCLMSVDLPSLRKHSKVYPEQINTATEFNHVETITCFAITLYFLNAPSCIYVELLLTI